MLLEMISEKKKCTEIMAMRVEDECMKSSSTIDMRMNEDTIIIGQIRAWKDLKAPILPRNKPSSVCHIMLFVNGRSHFSCTASM